MVGRKEDKGQIDGGRTDLHQDGICEIPGSCFRIGFARECSRKLKCGRNGRACGMDHHGVNVSPVGRRYASGMLKKFVQQGRSE